MGGRFPNVDWFCDGCRAYLNDQPGFDDDNDMWTCVVCGTQSPISSDAIQSEWSPFESYEDYMKSLKKDDTYTFTYSFEYIAKNHGNDKYDIDTATMEVRAEWSDSELGYVISYSVPDMYKIDPSQGNSDAAGFYEHDVYWRLMDDLGSLGIGTEIVAT